MSAAIEEKPKNDMEDVDARSRQRLAGPLSRLYIAPWWLIIFVLLWIFLVYQIANSDEFSRIYEELSEGISLTLFLSVTSYLFAIIVGLLLGIIRANVPQKPNHESGRKQKPTEQINLIILAFFVGAILILGPGIQYFPEQAMNLMFFLRAVVLVLLLISLFAPERFQSIRLLRSRRLIRQINHVVQIAIYNLATMYVEFMRGIPPLVFLLISGFILVPELRNTINESLLPWLREVMNNPEIPDLVWRGRDNGTAIAGLSLIYAAFLSEVFRAGIQSVDKGQIEAAKSLGMSYFQVLRYIIIPQAVRRMLPPLGNDFISMIKDTSLVTVLGINEITQLARKWSGSTFQ
ncbi:MAG: amino acid ABC transporter permease, partial [Anaerolineae bacterium]|nr:amino acid ABC transporter permease [Anaerolineae bacterium]